MRHPNTQPASFDRRDFLRGAGGLGGIALTWLLSQDKAFAATAAGQSGILLPGGLHHPPKVKRVVQLFMNGGVSQMDTFDPKPRLAACHGQRFDPGGGQLVESVTASAGFKVMQSPFAFAQHGQCGRWVSSVFPEMATCVDDLTFLMSMVSKSNVHGLASFMQNTGFIMPGYPCLGSWVSYALGRINDNLPAFVVLPDPKGLPYNNLGNFSAAFLPVSNQGTVVNATRPSPIHDLFPPKTAGYITPGAEADGRALLGKMNRDHHSRFPGDPRLTGRIEAYELAARMQLAAPELFELQSESPATRTLYGIDDEVTADFGRRCLTARRMLERGVRFVQVWSGPGGPVKNWDNHANIETELPYMARQTDKPVAALVKDLKSRGMLDDTLVVWTTEFGRMPFSQGQGGRDHNGGTFVTWLAGGGLKPGVAHGQSDEWGWKSETPIYCYDLHATILHLLGIDHERLTFRHGGADRRLTDVHGHVIREILA